MTAMENKVCEKEEGAALGWTISFPTFLVADCLDSWVAREVVQETEAGEEERTWFTHSSKSTALTDRLLTSKHFSLEFVQKCS